MTDINRELEILRYRVEENKKIRDNWIKFNISQKKINKLEEKIARDEEQITILENS
jgi:peptidoglycan hydrolase CwlO-like protein